MPPRLKYVFFLAFLLKCGNCQFVVPITTGQVGLNGGPYILAIFGMLIILIASLAKREEDLEAACDALLQDSEVSEAKEIALEDCKECTGSSKDDCENNSNCAYSDGTCFIKGDRSVPALYCSLVLRDPDQIQNCQLCFGLPEAECVEDEPRLDCNFATDVGLCVPDTDDFEVSP